MKLPYHQPALLPIIELLLGGSLVEIFDVYHEFSFLFHFFPVVVVVIADGDMNMHSYNFLAL